MDEVRRRPTQLVGAEDAALGWVVRRPGPRNASWARGQCRRHGPARAGQRRPATSRPRQVWKTPIGAPGHRTSVGAEPHRTGTRRADDAKAATQATATIRAPRRAANMARVRGRRASTRAVDQAVQSDGRQRSLRGYRVAAMLVGSRLSRIAPVSREMILNFVARRHPSDCPGRTDGYRCLLRGRRTSPS